MRIINGIKRRLAKLLVRIAPLEVFNALRVSNFDVMVKKLNVPGEFSWDSTKIRYGTVPDKFEDLDFLFFTCPLSRGILRQDIDEAALLFAYIRKLNNPKCVEIGRYHGGSTILLATAMGEGGHLTSIDIAPQSDSKLIEILNKLGLEGRVELLTADANEVNLDGQLDIAFIDGDHSYEGAMLDINKWGKQIKTGGFVILHDMANTRPYSSQWTDLAALREEIINSGDSCLRIVEERGSMTVFERTANEWVDVAPLAVRDEFLKL